MDRALLHHNSPDTYADLQKQMWFCWYVTMVLVIAIVTCPPEADAVCIAEGAAAGIETGLVIHLSPTCTPAGAGSPCSAWRSRYGCDRQGASCRSPWRNRARGSISSIALLHKQRHDPRYLRLEMANQPDRAGGNRQRIVREALSLKDSVVSGAVRHRSADSTLRFEGSVNFYGSHFKEGVDLSRSVFQEPVELSAATFDKEAYFVQGQFARQMDCRETKFGPSTRFHRSIFRGSVNCTGALFDGMAEFIEVTFEQPATFERSRFGLGTGFSGSRFKSRVSFSEAIFSRRRFLGLRSLKTKQYLPVPSFSGQWISHMLSSVSRTILQGHVSIKHRFSPKQSDLNRLRLSAFFKPGMGSMLSPWSFSS